MIGRALIAAQQYLDVRLRASWPRRFAAIGMMGLGLALAVAGALLGHVGLILAGFALAATLTQRGLAVTRADAHEGLPDGTVSCSEQNDDRAGHHVSQ